MQLQPDEVQYIQQSQELNAELSHLVNEFMTADREIIHASDEKRRQLAASMQDLAAHITITGTNIRQLTPSPRQLPLHQLLLERNSAQEAAISCTLVGHRLNIDGRAKIATGRAQRNNNLVHVGTELVKRATSQYQDAIAQWNNVARLGTQFAAWDNQVAASMSSGMPAFPTAPDISANTPNRPTPVLAVVSPVAPVGTRSGASTSQAATPAGPAGPSLQTLLDELNRLVGLAAVKAEVTGIVNQLHVQQLRTAHGLASPAMRWHMIFTGNPGTGKTTVARLLARIYQALGLLAKGHLVETDRGGLVAGYIGQTAIKTTGVVNAALGGVLFIDEAYALATGGLADFGQEAVDTLLKLMEDYRDDVIVIVAGYDDRMETFLEFNPGIRSRFSKHIHFPDYTAEELFEIFKHMNEDVQYQLSDGAKQKLMAFMEKLWETRGRNFGNARVVRNLFEETLRMQANRIASLASPTVAELQTIDEGDVPAVVAD
jgi:stage V sporulation protein K